MTDSRMMLSAVLVTCMLTACGQQLQDDDPDTVSKDNVFHDQVQSLDKAQQVEGTMQDAFEQQRQRSTEER